MPAKPPPIPDVAADALLRLGAALRERRSVLKVSATAAAEAAGLSRMTLHRIERGEPSVAAAGYAAAAAALGLEVQAVAATNERADPSRIGWVPARVALSNYPKLRELAWQLPPDAELSPAEALDIYERNWRHVDPATFLPEERELVEALRLALGRP